MYPASKDGNNNCKRTDSWDYFSLLGFRGKYRTINLFKGVFSLEEWRLLLLMVYQRDGGLLVSVIWKLFFDFNQLIFVPRKKKRNISTISHKGEHNGRLRGWVDRYPLLLMGSERRIMKDLNFNTLLC